MLARPIVVQGASGAGPSLHLLPAHGGRKRPRMYRANVRAHDADTDFVAKEEEEEEEEEAPGREIIPSI